MYGCPTGKQVREIGRVHCQRNKYSKITQSLLLRWSSLHVSLWPMLSPTRGMTSDPWNTNLNVTAPFPLIFSLPSHDCVCCSVKDPSRPIRLPESTGIPIVIAGERALLRRIATLPVRTKQPAGETGKCSSPPSLVPVETSQLPCSGTDTELRVSHNFVTFLSDSLCAALPNHGNMVFLMQSSRNPAGVAQPR